MFFTLNGAVETFLSNERDLVREKSANETKRNIN